MIPEMQNVFQEGDLILYDLKGPNKDFLPSKLTTPYKGPYVVLSQYKNDVTCKHANVGTVQVFHIDRIKPFYGSLEEATALAQVDYQQFDYQHHCLPRRPRKAQRNGIPARV